MIAALSDLSLVDRDFDQNRAAKPFNSPTK